MPVSLLVLLAVSLCWMECPSSRDLDTLVYQLVYQLVSQLVFLLISLCWMVYPPSRGLVSQLVSQLVSPLVSPLV